MKAAKSRREEVQRQRRLEERRKQLDTMAFLWVKSQNLRQFFRECEKAISNGVTILPDGAEARWLAWAHVYADELDPLKSGHVQMIAISSAE